MKSPPRKSSPDVPPLLERLALGAPRYIGSPTSLVLHTIFFVGVFGLQSVGFGFDQIMLILTTAVSLEAIYLSIFIQMTVNHQARQIEEVSEDVEEISEDVEDISEDVEEISKDIDTIQEDVKEISEDVEDIQEDVEEISEDVEELGEEIDKEEDVATTHTTQAQKIAKIETVLEELLREIRTLTTKDR